MRTVIVDDEELARARLRRLLEAHADVRVVAEFGDARRAASEVAALGPEMLLVDVRMPGRDGFDVATALGSRSCAIVFVTAWGDHAVRAFDAGAVDYVMKPVEAARLALALGRARRHLRRDPASPVASPNVATSRLAVREGEQLVIVSVADVDAAIARGNYVELRCRGKSYTVRTTLSSLEARLCPEAFVRVHRSVLLRTDRIVSLAPLFRGEYLLTLSDGTTYTSARGQRSRLRRALGI